MAEEFAESKAALQGFEEGLDLPPAPPCLLRGPGPPVPGGYEKAVFLPFPLLGWKSDPVQPQWKVRETQEKDATLLRRDVFEK
nr:hypothetical protein [Deinococcus hopiensis]